MRSSILASRASLAALSLLQRPALTMSSSRLLSTASSSSTPSLSSGNDVPHAKASLLSADCVCFDVDSTVIVDEGIDALAAHLGKGAEVKAWTTKAMDGGVKFQDALAARLDIIKPSRGDVASCLAAHPPVLSPGVKDLVESLRRNGKEVYLVSGGFRLMIEPVAEMLGLDPKENVIANTILFTGEGEYESFDETELTSRDMGKPAAMRHIMEKKGVERIVMVGDGATDAQAKPPAKAFVGYGGVVQRKAVLEKADWFVTDFQEMIDVLDGK